MDLISGRYTVRRDGSPFQTDSFSVSIWNLSEKF